MDQKPSSPSSPSTPAKKDATPAAPNKTDTVTTKPRATSTKSQAVKYAIGGHARRTHVIFQYEGRPLLADLESSATEFTRWTSLELGEYITVRGVHNNKEFCLHQCQLLSYQPPAETRFHPPSNRTCGSPASGCIYREVGRAASASAPPASPANRS